MDKNTVIGLAVVGALGVAGYVVWKKRDVLFPQSAVEPTGTTLVQQAATPSIAAMTTTYTPIPIGAVQQGQKDMSPPGVNPAGLEIKPVDQLNGNTNLPPLVDNSPGVSGNLADVTGNANVPTAPTAPSLSGNAKSIDDVYLSIFGRHAEQAGIDFWSGQMAAGTVTKETLVQHLTQGAQGSDLWNEVVIAPEAVIAHRAR